MTLKRQSVQSLSDHNTAPSFCVSQERGIVERMEQNKIVVPCCLEKRSGAEGGGGERKSE